MDKTYNFKREDYNYSVNEVWDRDFVDVRNNIICHRPTMDWECYENYIKYLNSQKFRWVNNGYLDLGMVPLAMAPSFMQAQVVDVMQNFARRIGVTSYLMPPVSLLLDKVQKLGSDLWVFKSDLAASLRIPEEKATLLTVLEVVKNDTIGVK